ncbi:MAG: hypothetical protein P1U61_05780 [Legionellaceae bacterium]|nr:hypothetical protein [Legionellaceae bacterium]
MPTLFRNQANRSAAKTSKDSNPSASPLTLNILSFISRFNGLNSADKEQLYCLFQQASTDDVTGVHEASGIKTLTKILKQKKTKHVFSSSPAYHAAKILAVFFSRNNAYRAIMLNHLLQSNITHPDTRAITFLNDINYEAIIQSTFNKTMYVLRTSKSTTQCASLVNLLSTLLVARDDLLKKYETRPFLMKIRKAIKFDGAGLDASIHGTVKRFFMRQDSVEQALIKMMKQIPDAKEAIQREHIKKLNQRYAHIDYNAHDEKDGRMSLSRKAHAP